MVRLKVVGYEKGKIGLLVLWNYKWDFWNVEEFYTVDDEVLNKIQNEDDFKRLIRSYEQMLKADDLIDDNSRIVFMPLKDNKDVDSFYYTDDVDDDIELTYELINSNYYDEEFGYYKANDDYYEPTGIKSYSFDLSDKKLYDLIYEMKLLNYGMNGLIQLELE